MIKKKSVMTFLPSCKCSLHMNTRNRNRKLQNAIQIPFFKAAARMLQIFCRPKTLNSTVFVVCVYAECIYIKIFCGPFPRQ